MDGPSDKRKSLLPDEVPAANRVLASPQSTSSFPTKATGFRPPVFLQGEFVRLIPLSRDHVPALARAGENPAIWAYFRTGFVGDESKMRENVTKFLENQHRGRDLPFTVVDAKTEELVGMSRFLDIERPNRAVEIGGSWLTPTRWRTPFNTEMKWLMLRYAFEVERFHRVQFRADLRNERSQRAIERIGALREGVLREHVVLWDGFLRSSASYSILEQEWPVVKEHLREILRRPWPAKVTDSP